MASTNTPRRPHLISPEAAMAGILAILVDEREERTSDDRSSRKTEILLSNAGLSVEDIVALTGKTSAAVRKTIERGRKK
jgi:hypothetical protein